MSHPSTSNTFWQKMFKSNKPVDPRKTWGKFLDFKRDGIARLKKLRSVIDSLKRPQEIKDFFIEHHRVIYAVFYEVFIQLDTIKYLKSKLAHEDVDLLMFILEKILIYLPEKIEKRWQLNSFVFVFQKLLNYSNLHLIRVEGLRLFIIFYQILGEANIRQNPKIEIMYAALVPGLVGDLERYHNPLLHMIINYDDTSHVFPVTNEYFYPEFNEIGGSPAAAGYGNNGGGGGAGSTNNSLAPEQKYFFCRRLLEYSISQCGKVWWKDFREKKHEKAFEFLVASFARIYLPYIFPRLACENRTGDWRAYTMRTLISIYNPPTELPMLVKYSDTTHYPIYTGHKQQQLQAQLAKLQSIVIDWFALHLLPNDLGGAAEHDQNNFDRTQTLTSQVGTLTGGATAGGNVETFGRPLSGGNLMSQFFNTNTITSTSQAPATEANEYDFGRIKALIDSKPFYVDLVINLFHQAFLMPYIGEYALTMKNVLKVYKQWINREAVVPQFLNYPRSTSSASISSSSASSPSPSNEVSVGCMNLYRIFIFSSVNVFLLEVPPQLSMVLAEQVELCKRALNAYRYMVMRVEMDKIVWENLVQALIQITKNIIPPQRPPKDRMEETLGGRLAAALIQTLIVTWIKANLHVALHNQLWEDFGQLLSSLISWEEVIKEWANTMSILTRVMSRYVFNINLSEAGHTDTKAKHRLRAAASHAGVLDFSETNSNGRINSKMNRAGVASTTTTNVEQTSRYPIASGTPNKMPDIGPRNQRAVSSCSSSAGSTPTTHQPTNSGRGFSFDQFGGKPATLKAMVLRNTLRQMNANQLPVLFHQVFHRNSSVGALVRSESDSCLFTSVSNSICGIKLGFRQSNLRRGSKISRSSRADTGSISCDNNGTPNKQNRNMPMIDDEVMDDDSTLADVDSCHQDPSEAFSDREALFIEDVLCNQALTAYFRIRGFHRARSMVDLRSKLFRRRSRAGTFERDDAASINNPDTLSLGNISLKDIPLGALGFDNTSSGCGSVNEHMTIIGPSRSSGSEHGIGVGGSSSHTLPVMLGGTHTGWNTMVSIILWRRMLGILGDITTIPDPALHKLAIDCLSKIIEDFSKLIEMIDFNVAGGSPGEAMTLLLPSLHWFVAWLFKTALELGDEYREGRMSAYKLLCVIAIHRTSEQNITPDFLALFYLTIKKAFFNYYQIVESQVPSLHYQPEYLEAQRLVNIIIKYCGSKFFASPLAGSSCLLNDFLTAASAIINEMDTKYPRVEALHLLGQLIGFFDIYKNVYILKSSVPRPELTPYQDLKENVLQILISASKREPTGLGRSISLCSLGIFLYKEFLNRSDSHRIKDVVNILVAGTKVSIKHTAPERVNSSPSNNADSATKFNNRILSRVACDMLRLQADHAAYLVTKYDGDIPSRIIKGLCYTLHLHLGVMQQLKVHKDFKHLLLSLMFTLAHWCMSVPKTYLNDTFVIVDFLPTLGGGGGHQGNDTSDQKISLMSLVLLVFNAIANLNISAIVFDASLDNVTSFGEMDVMDYTISDQQYHAANDTLRRSASPTRKSVFVGDDTVWQDANTVKRAAQLILLHFHNFMGHFSGAQLQTQSLSALVNENDDNVHVAGGASDKVDLEALNAPNVLVFVISDSCLMSFVELPPDSFHSTLLPKLASSGVGGKNTSAALAGCTQPIRVIIRNLLGKFAWDCAMLQPTSCGGGLRHETSTRWSSESKSDVSNNNSNSFGSDSDDSDDEDVNFLQSIKKDNFEVMLNEIVAKNPECHLPDPGLFMCELNLLPEAVDIVALCTNQHFQETSFNRQYRRRQMNPKAMTPTMKRVTLTEARLKSTRIGSGVDSGFSNTSQSSVSSSLTTTTTSNLDPSTAFQYCRQLIDQLGFLSPEKRSSIHLLAKNQHTIRELRHLDGQRCRETHKIAVIYVGPGQESKDAILRNKVGSRAFEDFVTRLGWEVNLATHLGFMGGLESNLSTGLTAPYYADTFNEIIFHVSTRLEPAGVANGLGEQSETSQQQLMTKKMRHLGNDEVHIVWSEHYKDYKRNIMATDFCDALIVIYPLPATTYPNLYRIVISRKQDVPFFGPLFNGAVVHRDELAALVRATAINASRAKRQNIAALRPFFEERHDAIHALATKYKEKSTFEEYATRIYAPRYDMLFGGEQSQTETPSTGLVDLETFVHSMNPTLKTRTIRSPSSAPATIAMDNISLLSGNSLTFDQTTGTPNLSSLGSFHSSNISHASVSVTSSPYPVQAGAKGTFAGHSSTTPSTASTARPISRNSLGHR